MFTEEDFISYFSDLEICEKNMRDIYFFALRKVEDPDVKKVFNGLLLSEKGHSVLIDEIRKIMIESTV